MFFMALTILPFGVVAGQSVTEQVLFSNAWIKKPMPGMSMSAGYVDIDNNSSADIRLVAVRTPLSKMAELHDMVMVNKVMQMRHAEAGWVIPAGAKLKLAPGGKHAMLMGVGSDAHALTKASLEFKFEGLGWVSVPAVVKMPMP